MESATLESPQATPHTSNLAALRIGRDATQSIHLQVRDALDESISDLERLIETVRKVWRDNNAQLIRDEAEAALNASLADSALREAVIHEYEETGEKQVSKELGLSVRINRKVEVIDRNAARDWAFKNAPMYLEVNEKLLTHMISINKDVPSFIKIEQTVYAVIAKKGAANDND